RRPGGSRKSPNGRRPRPRPAPRSPPLSPFAQEIASMTTTDPKAAVNRRYDFVPRFDVTDGNPNGDPDDGNMPSRDPQSLQGRSTDGCLKRKIRNAVAVLGEGRPGMELYFQTQDAVYEKRILNLIHQSAWDALGLKPVEQPENPPADEEGKGKGRKG